MQEGAFALIDCLGFKGIWKRMKDGNPEPLIKKLQLINSEVQGNMVSNNGNHKLLSIDIKGINTNIKLLSDTVAISCQLQNPDNEKLTEIRKFYLIGVALSSIVIILELFIKDDPHLTMRGCITFGEHISDGNFIVGPAVDEAAEFEKLAQGAFVWMHPSAASIYNTVTDRIMTHFIDTNTNDKEINDPIKKELMRTYLRRIITCQLVSQEYEMPIKGGDYLQCPVLNPLLKGYSSKQHRQQVIKAYSDAMTGNQLDVWLKKQNTMKFLQAAEDTLDKFIEANSAFEEIGLSFTRISTLVLD
jgi:hypothetical protein